MTMKPKSTTVPSTMRIACEKRILRYFWIIMAITSLPPVVAPDLTTMPLPTPISKAPMMEVSIRCSDMSRRPPISSVGSRLSNAALSGYDIADITFIMNGVMSEATQVFAPKLLPNRKMASSRSGISSI